MSTYEKPDTDQIEALEHAMRSWHPKLVEAGVRVDLLIAFGPVDKEGEKTGPAIVHQGIPCLGLCQITKVQLRVLGNGDALITLDGDRWPDLDEGEQLALIDHELTHLELVLEMKAKIKLVSTDGEAESEVCAQPQLDDAGRPKLRIRKHDFEVGWFHAVAKRHGRASQEVQQRQRFEDEAGQFYMWDAKPARSREPRSSSGVAARVSTGARTVTVKAKDTEELAAKFARAGLGEEKGKGL
jgi:hypothetical protein